jgi:hypothetical protein
MTQNHHDVHFLSPEYRLFFSAANSMIFDQILDFALEVSIKKHDLQSFSRVLSRA